MKHAIMVLGHGEDASILQKTIDLLDCDNIDFLYIGIENISNRFFTLIFQRFIRLKNQF